MERTTGFSYTTPSQHNQITGLLLEVQQTVGVEFCDGLQPVRSIPLIHQEEMWLDQPAATSFFHQRRKTLPGTFCKQIHTPTHLLLSHTPACTNTHTCTQKHTLPRTPQRKLNVWAVLQAALSESQVVTQQADNCEGGTATGFKSRWGGWCIKIMKLLLWSKGVKEGRSEPMMSIFLIIVYQPWNYLSAPFCSPIKALMMPAFLSSVVYIWSQSKHIIIILLHTCVSTLHFMPHLALGDLKTPFCQHSLHQPAFSLVVFSSLLPVTVSLSLPVAPSFSHYWRLDEVRPLRHDGVGKKNKTKH